MPIINLTETKRLLSLTDNNAYDSLITELIPIVQDKIITYCNNKFLNPDNRILVADTIAMVAGSPATITDSANGFLEAGFNDGCDINIYGSIKDNNGIYKVASVLAGVITLHSSHSLKDETAGSTLFTITKIEWPLGIKMDVANLIYKYMFTKGRIEESESLPGGYSIKYKTEQDLLKPFNIYKLPYI